MKKSLLTSLAFATITFMASCTKEDTTPASTWTLKGDTYKATRTFYDAEEFSPYFTLIATDSKTGTACILFKQKPTKDSIYNISLFPSDSTIGAFFVRTYDSSSYAAIRGKVSITIKNSRTIASFNEIALQEGMSFDSSSSSTGNLFEK